MPYNQYTDTIGRITSDIWIIFAVTWLLAALFAKKTAKGGGARWWIWRILFAPAVIILVHFAGVKSGMFLLLYIDSAALRTIGAVLVILGIILCFWARYHLGRNWGMPMSEKAGAELVTTGPYAYIRHPIYAGALVSFIGSILVFGVLWIYILIVAGGYFLFAMGREDKIMARLFPDKYQEYKARTKRLVPGMW